MNEDRNGFRCWINQPSTLQPYHQFHGERGIAVLCPDGNYRFYFLCGDTESMHVDSTALGRPWPTHEWNEPLTFRGVVYYRHERGYEAVEHVVEISETSHPAVKDVETARRVLMRLHNVRLAMKKPSARLEVEDITRRDPYRG